MNVIPATDQQLLARFRNDRAEDAFAEIVSRHLPLVHSAALRQVGSPHLAEEVAQSVFAGLARQAPRLDPDIILPAWLYQVTRRAAIDVVRRETRRQTREQIATQMNPPHSSPDDWNQIEPLLDEAVASLDAKDRAAILLRFFQNKSLREVGRELGLSDDAAQKRVARAVQRLRQHFTRRGISLTASGLIAAISAHAVTAAPATLAAAVASAAITATTAAGTLSASAALNLNSFVTPNLLVMTTAQKTIAAAALLAALGTGVYEVNKNSNLRRQLQTLERRQLASKEELLAAQTALEHAAQQIAALRRAAQEENSPSDELLKLRAEVTRLRADAPSTASAHPSSPDSENITEALSWQARVASLKQHLDLNPQAQIPELRLATPQDWLNATKEDLRSEEDFRKAASSLRHHAQTKFAPQLQNALQKYLAEHHQKFPTDIRQLLPYLENPIDGAILQRYAILPKDQIPSLGMGGDWIISPVSPVDPDFDSRIGIGPNGFGSVDSSAWNDPLAAAFKILEPILESYAAANGGKEPSSPADLIPYIQTPEQKNALQKASKLAKPRQP